MNDCVHDSEIGKRAPWVQQWFRTLFAEGGDMIKRSVHLALRLAAGDADALSGRSISVKDDLDALVKQFGAGAPTDQRLLGVNGTAALSVG
jgi:hypothetical protein